MFSMEEHENLQFQHNANRQQAHSPIIQSEFEPNAEELPDAVYTRLVLSLQSPLPNEFDASIAACVLFSSGSKYRMKLTKAPQLLSLLLGHSGIFDDNLLRTLIEETYGKISDVNHKHFWKEYVSDFETRKLLCEFFVRKEQLKLRMHRGYEDEPTVDLESMNRNDQVYQESVKIKHEKERRKDIIAKMENEEWETLNTCCSLCSCQEVMNSKASISYPHLKTGSSEVDDRIGRNIVLIANIMLNLSFDGDNAVVMASNSAMIRFLLLASNCSFEPLPKLSLDILGNLAQHMRLHEPTFDPISSMAIELVTNGLFSSDRLRILQSLEILEKMSKIEENVNIIMLYFDKRVYPRLTELLTVCDILLLIRTLDCIFSMTNTGNNVICNEFVNAFGLVSTLVSLLTAEFRSYQQSGRVRVHVSEINERFPEHHPQLTRPTNESTGTMPPHKSRSKKIIKTNLNVYDNGTTRSFLKLSSKTAKTEGIEIVAPPKIIAGRNSDCARSLRPPDDPNMIQVPKISAALSQNGPPFKNIEQDFETVHLVNASTIISTPPHNAERDKAFLAKFNEIMSELYATGTDNLRHKRIHSQSKSVTETTFIHENTEETFPQLKKPKSNEVTNNHFKEAISSSSSKSLAQAQSMSETRANNSELNNVATANFMSSGSFNTFMTFPLIEEILPFAPITTKCTNDSTEDDGCTTDSFFLNFTSEQLNMGVPYLCEQSGCDVCSSMPNSLRSQDAVPIPNERETAMSMYRQLEIPTVSQYSQKYGQPSMLRCTAKNSFKGKCEQSVTNSIRLTTALIIRDLVKYSDLGRKCFKGYESYFSIMAMCDAVSSRTVSKILYELNEHNNRPGPCCSQCPAQYEHK